MTAIPDVRQSQDAPRDSHGDVNCDRRYLGARLSILESRVRSLVDQRRSTDPSPSDPFRGLYLSEDAIARLLDEDLPAVSVDGSEADLKELEDWADSVEPNCPLRLRGLTRSFGLSELDVNILLVALAPDLDIRFEWSYGYLHDDVTRRRASPGLAIKLCGGSPSDGHLRSRMLPGGPLVDHGLIQVEDRDRPFLTRALRVPDRIVSHLLGQDHADVRGLTSADAEAESVLWMPAERQRQALADALRREVRLVYVWQPRDGTGVLLAQAALAAVGRPALHFSIDRISSPSDFGDTARQVAREAVLREAGVIITGQDAAQQLVSEAFSVFTDLPIPVVVVGTNGWNPDWSDDIPLIFEASELSPDERDSLVRSYLGEALEAGPAGADGQSLVLGQFSVGPRQAVRAARSALLQSGLNGGRVSHADLHLAVRRQNNTGLERLARRIAPEVSWADLVLPPAQLLQLHELADRARYRELVLRTWGMRRGGGRGRGVTALFAGDSGTGKTMSAEVLAGELGLDLYAVDLSTVVDKYVGETEKNLERIFTEATQVNGVLLFDEADAIFGKRSEVRDAHDRYANIESAYLLQRMEAFEGLAVLSTNLRANLDEAFTRRLDIVVDFPAPDEEHRRKLWLRSLGEPLPVDDDLDLAFCAKAFELSGGNIRSAATSAAYRAAREGRSVAMVDVMHGIVSEYRKLGRLCQEREFGPYQHLLTTAGE